MAISVLVIEWRVLYTHKSTTVHACALCMCALLLVPIQQTGFNPLYQILNYTILCSRCHCYSQHHHHHHHPRISSRHKSWNKTYRAAIHHTLHYSVQLCDRP